MGWTNPSYPSIFGHPLGFYHNSRYNDRLGIGFSLCYSILVASVRGHSIAGAPQCWNLGFSIMPRDHAAGRSRERDRGRFLRATKLWGSVDGSCGDGKWWTGLTIKGSLFLGGVFVFFWWDGACFCWGGVLLSILYTCFEITLTGTSFAAVRCYIESKHDGDITMDATGLETRGWVKMGIKGTRGLKPFHHTSPTTQVLQTFICSILYPCTLLLA